MIYSGFCRQKFFALKNPIMKFSNFLQLAFWKFLCYAKLWEFKVQTQKQHISIKFTAPNWAIMEGTCDIDFSHCHLFYSFSLRKRIRGMYQSVHICCVNKKCTRVRFYPLWLSDVSSWPQSWEWAWSAEISGPTLVCTSQHPYIIPYKYK